MENSKRIEAPNEISVRRMVGYCSPGHLRSWGTSLNDVTKWVSQTAIAATTITTAARWFARFTWLSGFASVNTLVMWCVSSVAAPDPTGREWTRWEENFIGVGLIHLISSAISQYFQWPHSIFSFSYFWDGHMKWVPRIMAGTRMLMFHEEKYEKND